MLEINLQNVEEIIFYNNKLHHVLPEFSYLFDQWKLSRYSPALKNLGKRSIIDFLNKINQDQIKILEKHLGTTIYIKGIDTNIVKNYNFLLDNAEEKLNCLEDVPNFCVSRDESSVYISFWK